MSELTIPSSFSRLRSSEPLSPAMTAVIWEIAAEIDASRIDFGAAVMADMNKTGTWVEIPTQRLRKRQDNHWLKKCLDRLTGVKISGSDGEKEWGAVLVAEWEISDRGMIARVMLPPSALFALVSPTTFAKIEQSAAHQLTSHGRQLYMLLADKKRMKQTHWTFDLAELRDLMGVSSRKSYALWSAFRRKVLDPAVQDINDFGTVQVEMTPLKRARTIDRVRFDWSWKDPRSAAKTALENDRHSKARRKKQDDAGAPPMIENTPQTPSEPALLEHEPQADPAMEWWHQLSDDDRTAWKDLVGAVIEQRGPGGRLMKTPRRERDIARDAYESEHGK